MEKNKTNKMVNIAMIGALYAVITLVISPIAYGPIQFRISEMLTILPMFTPLAIPGLTLGCLLSNLIGALIGVNPTGYIDAIVGSSATLISAIMSYYIGKSCKNWLKYIFVPMPAVIVNALVIGAEITFLFNQGQVFLKAFIANATSVFIGQLVICYTLGIILIIALNKNKLYKKIFLN